MVKLVYYDKLFHESSGKDESAVAILEINESARTAKLSFLPDATLIAKRTAMRQANGICKTGFLLKNGQRIGTGSTLEVEEESSIDNRLLQEGHKYK